jgi:hypothetical protein
LPETGGKPFLNTQYFQPGKPFVPSTPSKVFAAQAQAGAGAVRNQVGNAAPARRTTLAGR